MSTSPITRLVMSGLIGPVQSWSCGLTFTHNQVPNDPALFAWVSAVAPDVANFWGLAARSMNVAAWSYRTLSAYSYAAGGTVAAHSAAAAVTPVVGNGANPSSSNNALVVTLRSGNAGRAKRGRFYVPMTAAGPVVSLNYIEDGHVDDLANQTVALITAIVSHQLGGQTVSACVATPRAATPPYLLAAVSVDNKIDAQRNRSDKFLGTHVKNVAL